MQSIGNVAKQLLLTLSRTVQSKDFTAASRMRYVHAPAAAATWA
jgi:hypothetical protein